MADHVSYVAVCTYRLASECTWRKTEYLPEKKDIIGHPLSEPLSSPINKAVLC